MANELIAPVFTLIGVTIGVTLTYLANSKIKSRELKEADIREQLIVRRLLYARFLGESGTLILQSLEKKNSSPTVFGKLSQLSAEVELVASECVFKKAIEIMGYVVDCHSESFEGAEKTYSQLRGEFVLLAKEEFQLMRK